MARPDEVQFTCDKYRHWLYASTDPIPIGIDGSEVYLHVMFIDVGDVRARSLERLVIHGSRKFNYEATPWIGIRGPTNALPEGELAIRFADDKRPAHPKLISLRRIERGRPADKVEIPTNYRTDYRNGGGVRSIIWWPRDLAPDVLYKIEWSWTDEGMLERVNSEKNKPR